MDPAHYANGYPPIPGQSQVRAGPIQGPMIPNYAISNQGLNPQYPLAGYQFGSPRASVINHGMMPPQHLHQHIQHMHYQMQAHHGHHIPYPMQFLPAQPSFMMSQYSQHQQQPQLVTQEQQQHIAQPQILNSVDLQSTQEEKRELENIVHRLLKSPPPPPPPEPNPSTSCDPSVPSAMSTDDRVDQRETKPIISMPSLPSAFHSSFDYDKSDNWVQNLNDEEKKSFLHFDAIWRTAKDAILRIPTHYDDAVKTGNVELARDSAENHYPKAIQILSQVEGQLVELKKKVEDRLANAVRLGNGPQRKKAKTKKKARKENNAGQHNNNNPTSNISRQPTFQLSYPPDIKPSKAELGIVDDSSIEPATSDNVHQDEDERTIRDVSSIVNPFDAAHHLKEMQKIQGKNNSSIDIMSFVEDHRAVFGAVVSKIPITEDRQISDHPISSENEQAYNAQQDQHDKDSDYRPTIADCPKIDVVDISDSEPEEPTDPYFKDVDVEDWWIMNEMRPLAEKYSCRDRLVTALAMVRRRVALIKGFYSLEQANK